MKIKITENQALRLNLLNENLNPLTQFENLCMIKIREVNKLFLKVTSISIGEILNNEIDISKINFELNKIEDDIRISNRKAYAFIDGLTEEDLDVRIDRADSNVINRLTSLQLITMDLETLQISAEEHKIIEQFGDVNPIDITNSQN